MVTVLKSSRTAGGASSSLSLSSKKKPLSIAEETLQLRRRSQGLIIFLLCLAGIIFLWVGLIEDDDALQAASATTGGGSIVKDNYDSNDDYDDDLVNFGQNTGGGGGGKSNNAGTRGSSSTSSSSSSNNNNNNNNHNCAALCDARRQERTTVYGGDILNRAGLISVAQMEQSKLIDKLHKDYGNQTFQDIFVDKKTQRYHSKKPVTETGPSIELLKRKFKLKVLAVQTALAKRDVVVTGGCDCRLNAPSSSSGDSTPAAGDTTTPVRYVWATGGHSASAGHGNMYSESYTAYMERDLKPIFAALGMDFEGRNYAMGGTGSGYEVSMCYEQIFGNDIDFMSWDYGMTDGNAYIRLLHYGYRGGLLGSSSQQLGHGHPIPIMGLHIGGRAAGARVNKLSKLEELGQPTFVGLSNDDSSLLFAGIPDSSGKSDEEIDAMPEFVRNFKCEGKIESGDPYCGKEKYTHTVCTPRAKQVSWHPGFKNHALDGHTLSLFMVQYLLDALNELEQHEEKDPEKLLAMLQQEEDDNFQTNFVNAELPQGIQEFYKKPNEDEDAPDIDNEIFFKGPSICRTARLPAKSRYLGIMTADISDKTGDVAPFTHETYETGISERVAKETVGESNNDLIRLVYGEDRKERDPSCTTEILKPDYKDFYYATTNDGLMKMIFPNDAEKVAYRYDVNKNNYQGYLIVFLAGCDWGKCAKGELREKDMNGSSQEDDDSVGFEMYVNGEKVKTLVNLGSGGSLLIGETEASSSSGKWKPNANGNYEIGIHVKRPSSYVRISAIVMY